MFFRQQVEADTIIHTSKGGLITLIQKYKKIIINLSDITLYADT